jgi:hypothetical protein
MVQATPVQLGAEHSATIRALSSLTRRDAGAVRATVRAAGDVYAVEEHDDYDGYRSLLLTPPQEGRAAYLVSGRTGAVDLAAVQGDAMTALGCYPSIGAAMLVLRTALEREQAQAAPHEDARALCDRHGEDADLHAAMRADLAEGDRWCAVIRAIDAREDH